MSDTDSYHGLAIPVDGVDRHLPYVQRPSLVDRVIATAKRSPAVIVGAPPAMGKTSLIQMVKWKLVADGLKVHRKRLISSEGGSGPLRQWLEKKGIAEDEDELDTLQETWLLFDDAHNAYGKECYSFWEHLLKGVKTSDAKDKVFVVIAATYDLATPDSPVVFGNLPHVVPHFSSEEVHEVVQIYSDPLEVSSWHHFFTNLVRVARLPQGNFHIGIVTAGFHLIQNLKKAASAQAEFSEQQATGKLRSREFLSYLQRCFGLPVEADNHGIHAVSYDIADAILHQDSSSVPTALLRSGILTINGQFTSLAASWYYNRVCFPNRANRAPDSLDDLVRLAVPLMSAKRLSDTLENGFPKEATFQHLFNEALSVLLPVGNYLIPEFNTFALDEKGNPVHGELDFYINGNLQWCLELLRNGDKIGEHLERFDPNIGKYREVQQRSYLVVDCRGPKIGSTKVDNSRCTLYFARDFRSCICKMRLNEEFTIRLKP